MKKSKFDYLVKDGIIGTDELPKVQEYLSGSKKERKGGFTKSIKYGVVFPLILLGALTFGRTFVGCGNEFDNQRLKGMLTSIGENTGNISSLDQKIENTRDKVGKLETSIGTVTEQISNSQNPKISYKLDLLKDGQYGHDGKLEEVFYSPKDNMFYDKNNSSLFSGDFVVGNIIPDILENEETPEKITLIGPRREVVNFLQYYINNTSIKKRINFGQNISNYHLTYYVARVYPDTYYKDY